MTRRMNTTPIEEWRPVTIAEFSAFYEVSNLGRIRSLDRVVKGKSGCLQRSPGRIMKVQINTWGYASIHLHVDPHDRTFAVHRLVAAAFIPNPLAFPEINHKDGVKTNAAADNLEWTTRIGNYLHAAEIGTAAFRRKLSDDDVAVIRALAAAGGNLSAIARQFGVCPSAISQIVSGRRRVNHQFTPVSVLKR